LQSKWLFNLNFQPILQLSQNYDKVNFSKRKLLINIIIYQEANRYNKIY
jgi:hypothetical protein